MTAMGSFQISNHTVKQFWVHILTSVLSILNMNQLHTHSVPLQLQLQQCALFRALPFNICITVTGFTFYSSTPRYWQSATGSSAGIVFTHEPILGFFTPQGRHVALIKVKFGKEERTSPCQISPWSVKGWGFTAPKTEKMEFYQYNCL